MNNMELLRSRVNQNRVISMKNQKSKSRVSKKMIKLISASKKILKVIEKRIKIIIKVTENGAGVEVSRKITTKS